MLVLFCLNLPHTIQISIKFSPNGKHKLAIDENDCHIANVVQYLKAGRIENSSCRIFQLPDEKILQRIFVSVSFDILEQAPLRSKDRKIAEII